MVGCRLHKFKEENVKIPFVERCYIENFDYFTFLCSKSYNVNKITYIFISFLPTRRLIKFFFTPSLRVVIGRIKAYKDKGRNKGT